MISSKLKGGLHPWVCERRPSSGRGFEGCASPARVVDRVAFFGGGAAEREGLLSSSTSDAVPRDRLREVDPGSLMSLRFGLKRCEEDKPRSLPTRL